MKVFSALTLVLAGSVLAQEAILDLTQLHSYADQSVPSYITKDNTPLDNPITDMGATLGRVLFYDTRLSKNRAISCSSCHDQSTAFGDSSVASTGVAGTTGRHSMRLINARFADERNFFWDERAPSLEAQSTQPIQDHIEMGFSGEDGDPDFSALVERIAALEFYKVLFTGVYGDPAVTEDRMQDALAQFIRSIQSFDSKYDLGRVQAVNDGVPLSNFTAQENQGKNLFLTPPGPGRGAGCAACHRAPEFDIDPRSGHNGVTGSLGGGVDRTNTRAPSLRDLVTADGAPHGGFMHDASLPTLLDVVNHYDAIPAPSPGLDPRLSPGGRSQRLGLSDVDKAALVAFLETLTGTSVYSDPKWSTPFDGEGNLSLVVLPANIEVTPNNEMIQVTGRGVPNVSYLLKSSSDLKMWDDGVSVTADANGGLLQKIESVDSAQFYIFVYEVAE